jgi:hypothetical protein
MLITAVDEWRSSGPDRHAITIRRAGHRAAESRPGSGSCDGLDIRCFPSR